MTARTTRPPTARRRLATAGFARVWLVVWLALAAGLIGRTLWLNGADRAPVAVASSAETIDQRLIDGCLLGEVSYRPAERVRRTFRPIERLRVGERVLADNPDEASPAETAVDPATWRRLTLYAEETWPDGTLDTIHIQTLQPPAWIELFGASVGAEVPPPLDLVEMGLPEDLLTRVVKNEPCPPLQPPLAGDDRGRLVLTTVNHLNPDVWELTCEPIRGPPSASTSGASAEQTLQPTGFHKFYSETRSDWVSTNELEPGEVIRGRGGPLRVTRVWPQPGVERVYNLTVEGEHVYYVGELGLLAHNNCGGDLIDNNILTRIISGDAEAVKFATRRNGRLTATDSVIGEALIRHGTEDVGIALNKFGINRIANPNQADVAAEMAKLGVLSKRHAVDVSLISAARQNGLGLVTADTTLFKRAHRSGVSGLQFRIFDHATEARVAAYNKIRQYLTQQGTTRPNAATGSP